MEDKDKDKKTTQKPGKRGSWRSETPHRLDIIKLEELELLESIGAGAFGQVYKAKYKDKLVAVKFGDGSKKKDFAHELDLLSSVSHRNIVELYGAQAGTRFFLVMELCVTNLSNYYKTHEYGHKELNSWAMQIAEAMQHLHSKKIVHRDLKTANILLDSNNYIKLCDFGTARDFELTTVMTFVGTISYMAPELLKELPVSEKVDVYSFAVVLWELITKQAPFSTWKPVQIIWFVAGENRRLPIPDDAPTLFKEIIESSWNEDPHQRPSFNDILTRLMKELTSKVDLDSQEDQPPLAEFQQRWNLTIGMTMEEYKQMKIISELDEIKKKDAALKEREVMIQKRESELQKEVNRLNLEQNSEAAAFLRRIKSCPAPKKGQSRRYVVKTDFNGQVAEDNQDFLLSPRSRTASTNSSEPLSPKEGASPKSPTESPSPTKTPPEPTNILLVVPTTPPRERRENSFDGSDQEESEGNELLLDYQVIRN